MINLLVDMAAPAEQGRALFAVRPATAALQPTAETSAVFGSVPAPSAAPAFAAAFVEMTQRQATLDQNEGVSFVTEHGSDERAELSDIVIDMHTDAVQVQTPDTELFVVPMTLTPTALAVQDIVESVGTSSSVSATSGVALNLGTTSAAASQVPVVQLAAQTSMNANAIQNAAVFMSVAQPQDSARLTADTAVNNLTALDTGSDVSVSLERAFAQLASASVGNASNPLHTTSLHESAGAKAAAANDAARPTLATLLGDRLQLQIERRSEQAVVRLDPPSMGTIEIIVRQEAGSLHVQLRASNSEVARQLQGLGETLRQDLVQRQQNDVSVQVWDTSRDADSRQRQKQQQAWQDEPGRALGAADERTSAFALDTE